MSQRSPDNMTIMCMQKVLSAAQKKLDLSEKALLEMELPLKPKVNVAPPHPKARVFLSELLQNIDRPPQAHHFTAETYSAAFIIRTMSNQAYEFLRRLIPLRQIKHVDEYFKPELDAVELQTKDIQCLPSMLTNYRDLPLPEGYSGGITSSPPDGPSRTMIPCVLGVDAMAIEPYSEKNKRLLFLSQVLVSLAPEQLRELEEATGIGTYLFVFNLMPLDPTLPNLAISVVPHTNGKANGASNAYLPRLKAICAGAWFWVIAFSGDGDNGDEEFLTLISEQIRSEQGQQTTFGQLVAEMGRTDSLLMTDFLHVRKYLRNRLSTHPVSLHRGLPPACADELAVLPPIADALRPESNGSQ
jgi:hypothetical protein